MDFIIVSYELKLGGRLIDVVSFDLLSKITDVMM